MSTSYQIASERIAVSVSEQGAELISVRDNQTNFEFIWQANPQVWGRFAPVLFPIVGKLNQNKILINNQEFQMSQHGFARDCSFEMIELYTDLVKFMLCSNERTLEQYPFQFKFFISYEVVNNELKITYTVLNEDIKPMYFSVGAHPGFNLPVHDLSKFHIQFEKEENLNRYLLEDGLQNGLTENIGSNQSVLKLNSQLFDKDAIVLKNLSSRYLSLVQTDGKYEVKLDFEGFPFMGIWSKKGNQEFICLEPWQGIADSVGFNEDISKKEGIICLQAGEENSFSYTLTFSAP